MSRKAALVLLALALASGGCGAAGGGQDATSTAPATEIARIHRTKCGACHVRVEPGERTRAQIEAALPRHRTRVHLREEQWAEMVDYLAPAGVPAGGRATTSSP
jgi:hypothetical protein